MALVQKNYYTCLLADDVTRSLSCASTNIFHSYDGSHDVLYNTNVFCNTNDRPHDGRTNGIFGTNGSCTHGISRSDELLIRSILPVPRLAKLQSVVCWPGCCCVLVFVVEQAVPHASYIRGWFSATI